MEDSDVGLAEKEASEVLHSLLSIERVQKPLDDNDLQQIVVVHDDEDKEEIDWQTSQPDFGTIHEDNGDVVWETYEHLDEGTDSDEHIQILEDDEEIVNNIPNAPEEPVKKPVVRKKYKKDLHADERTIELENNVQDVRARFQQGCECVDDSCFSGLSPEYVYRHRLNIAELTKEEHDMYLMGVTMACMSDPGVTRKRKTRRRLRAHYVYQGRRVCLSAFLYLENCTLYQLKRIRKHVTTHGVTPRVHGNHGKKPHNVFSLDIYRRATQFLKSYIEHHTNSSGNLKAPVVLPADVSRKTIHNTYQEYVKSVAPSDEKILGYSTFRHFMREQFPQLRFCKSEQGTSASSAHSNNNSLKQGPSRSIPKTDQEQQITTLSGTEIFSSGQVATIPILITEKLKQDGVTNGPTFIVTPVQQIINAQQEFASFQPQTTTVVPLANTAYAFTTM